MLKVIRQHTIYLLGLFLMTFGVGLSIQTDFGVSPVSSLAYGLTLITGISVGIFSVLANICYYIIQAILTKHFRLKEVFAQFVISFLFGFFLTFSLFIIRIFPAPETLLARAVMLFFSLIISSVGALGYFTARLPLTPYDTLTSVITKKFNVQFSKAKISCDVINVIIAGSIGLIFIQSLGSIGIGTLASAYFTGKIAGWLLKNFQSHVTDWINGTTQKRTNELNAL